MIRLPAALLAALLVGGCASPETRLRTGLVDAGLPDPLAACMAGRMADRLSITQLRRIGDLPRARRSGGLDEFLHRVRALGDTEILAVTGTAAARCATGL